MFMIYFYSKFVLNLFVSFDLKKVSVLCLNAWHLFLIELVIIKSMEETSRSSYQRNLPKKASVDVQSAFEQVSMLSLYDQQSELTRALKELEYNLERKIRRTDEPKRKMSKPPPSKPPPKIPIGAIDKAFLRSMHERIHVCESKLKQWTESMQRNEQSEREDQKEAIKNNTMELETLTKQYKEIHNKYKVFYARWNELNNGNANESGNDKINKNEMIMKQ
ncbi:hypothetical protein RFI_02993 [Reticulomyxa filosa]|uniref:Uncharacterized protein n=1 Tax=Reticulomyxa filosa TaxID=46433 RepID=X6P6E5_RETFI|nr:hypothetical protein RFI_02993 [Reticulomyxa filosa]|eukprot:ETO34100.1 hypothetical protein RFI_02993 [Reticulomyxa filosa]